jgi:hypothetical protein
MLVNNEFESKRKEEFMAYLKLFLAYFIYFEIMKWGFRYHIALCVSVCPP